MQLVHSDKTPIKAKQTKHSIEIHKNTLQASMCRRIENDIWTKNLKLIPDGPALNFLMYNYFKDYFKFGVYGNIKTNLLKLLAGQIKQINSDIYTCTCYQMVENR